MRTVPSSFTPPTGAFAGFIFDCDGTLADTMPLHHLAWQRALEEHGARFDFPWDLFVSRAGMTLEQTVVELAEQFGVALDAPEVARSQRRFYAELEPTMQPIVDVIEYARRAARRSPVSVASGSQRATVDRTLSHLGLDGLFPVIVTPEDVLRGKPAPDMFLLAAERMGVAPERCLVFEDGAMGIQAARSAGMAVVRVEAPRPEEVLIVAG